MKPIMRSSAAWTEHHSNVVQLAECMQSYCTYLKEKKVEVQTNQCSEHPVRQVCEHTTVESRPMSTNVLLPYEALDAAIQGKDYIFFDEDLHVLEKFQNNMQRHRQVLLIKNYVYQ